MRIFRSFKQCRRRWLLLLMLLAMGWAQDRPLPEVAREKTGKKAARVLTNEDLESGRPQEASPAPAPAAAESSSAQNTTKGPINVAGLLEEATPARAGEILQSLKRDEQQLLRRYAQIEQKLATEQDEHLRQLYSNSLARREETLARKRQQIQQVEKAIEAAEKNRPPRSKYEPASKPAK